MPPERNSKLNGKSFQLLVTRSLREPTEFLDGLRKIFYIAVPLALLLAGLGGYFLARQSLAPVVSMSNQAARIGSTNLDERLPIKNERDELGGLAKVTEKTVSGWDFRLSLGLPKLIKARSHCKNPIRMARFFRLNSQKVKFQK